MLSVENARLEKIEHPLFDEKNVQVFVQRDDLIHPLVSGNKWRKLKYNLLAWKNSKKEGVLTFGGAYSNHLLATAAACQLENIPCIGMVRGEELNPQSNATLAQCSALGMRLIFMDRMTYQMREDKQFIEELSYEYPNYYIIPEGGANYYGMIGCQEIVKDFPSDIQAVFVAQGTTTTSSGILLGLSEQQSLFVVPALKGFDVAAEMEHRWRYAGFPDELWEEKQIQLQIKTVDQFGGYGKWNEELIQFIKGFYQLTKIPLDVVYTGKAMYALMEEIKRDRFNHQQVVFVHTGGLQGNPEELKYLFTI